MPGSFEDLHRRIAELLASLDAAHCHEVRELREEVSRLRDAIDDTEDLVSEPEPVGFEGGSAKRGNCGSIILSVPPLPSIDHSRLADAPSDKGSSDDESHHSDQDAVTTSTPLPDKPPSPAHNYPCKPPRQAPPGMPGTPTPARDPGVFHDVPALCGEGSAPKDIQDTKQEARDMPLAIPSTPESKDGRRRRSCLKSADQRKVSPAEDECADAQPLGVDSSEDTMAGRRKDGGRVSWNPSFIASEKAREVRKSMQIETPPAAETPIRRSVLIDPAATSGPLSPGSRAAPMGPRLSTNALAPFPRQVSMSARVSGAFAADISPPSNHLGPPFQLWPAWDFIGGRESHNSATQAKQFFRGIARMIKTADLSSVEDDGDVGPLGALMNVLQLFVLHPGSPKLLAWHGLAMVLILYEIVVIPLSAFDLEFGIVGETMLWVSAVFWSLSIIVGIFVGYHSNCELECNIKKTAWHYFTTSFVFDLIVVTVDWWALLTITLAPQGDESENESRKAVTSVARAAKSVKTMSMLRIFRLFRVVKLPAAVKELALVFQGSEFLNLCIGILKHFVMILLINHVIACLWYLIGRNGWVKEYMARDEAWEMLYLTSLHWTVTQFTPASMLVNPQNLGERLFTVVVIFFALISFSSFVSSVTNSMNHLRSLKSAESKQFAKLERFLHDHNIPFTVAVRIRRYLEHAMLQQKKRLQMKDVELLAKLSTPLTMELHFEVKFPAVSVHPFFAHYAEANVRAMHQLCHSGLRSVHLSTDDVLFNPGEIASSMFFVLGGELVYRKQLDKAATDPDASMRTSDAQGGGDQVFEKQAVHAGEWICEMVLWTPWEYHGQLRAATESSLDALDAAQFHDIVVNNKAGQGDIRMYACAALQLLNGNSTSLLGYSDLESETYTAAQIMAAAYPDEAGGHEDESKSHFHFHFGGLLKQKPKALRRQSSAAVFKKGFKKRSSVESIRSSSASQESASSMRSTTSGQDLPFSSLSTHSFG